MPATIVSVRLSSLKGLSFNPAKRTELARLRKLMASMKELKQLVPILITADHTIIEGHRRVAAAKKLGWKTVDAIVRGGDVRAIYAAVNSTAQPLTGNDQLGIWLKEPDAVSDRVRRQIEAAAEELGRPLLKKMYRSGLSMRTYVTARRLADYMDWDRPQQVRKTVEWLINCGSARMVEKYLGSGLPAAALRSAVTRGRPLKFQLKVA